MAARALTDDSFQALRLDGFQYFLAIAGEVLGIADVIVSRENFFQQRFTFDERHAAQVVPIQIKNIEGIKCCGMRT